MNTTPRKTRKKIVTRFIRLMVSAGFLETSIYIEAMKAFKRKNESTATNKELRKFSDELISKYKEQQ